MHQVCIVGSGNWGTTIGKIIGENVVKNKKANEKVNIWVYEEEYKEKKLSQCINKDHENPKYLPGIKLPSNLYAETNLINAVKEADVIFFALPHNFLEIVVKQLIGHVKKTSRAVSLMKGINVTKGKGLVLLSDVISTNLGIYCAVVMGANRAGEVSGGIYGEATVGSVDVDFGILIKHLLQTDYLRLVLIKDQVGTELCGALKNIVAIITGITDGLGHGDNTKAAFIRLGYWEILEFMQQFYKDRGVNKMTVFQSCGFAEMFMCLAHNKDLMSTPIDRCYGSRNILAGMNLAKTDMSMEDIEKKVLKGALAEGAHTTREVYEMLNSVGQQHKYPLIVTTYKICQREVPASSLIIAAQNHPAHL